MRQISLDTETTGLDPKEGHRIIEIGCVEIINRRITGNHFHCYINPERDIDKGAQAVHGISQDFLADKPVFASVKSSFIDYIQGADEIIIHNAPFDVGFLNNEFVRLDKKSLKLASYAEIVDTLTMARQLHPGQKNSLDALCKRYDVDNSHRDLHGALVDADLLARVYLIMTGGQDSFFTEETATTSAATPVNKQENKKITRNGKIPVLYANQEEAEKHKNYMAALKDK